MPTVATVLARTLKAAGVTRMFGLPGGEVLDFIEAARREGIDFVLTRHEAAAALMADVTGQISGRPGVCVATLGPGAVNLTLGVANAYLDRSPVIAITAATSLATGPVATHQRLDLNALYRPITKQTLTLDGVDTAATVREAIATSLAPRRGPVHLALSSDVARADDRPTGRAGPEAGREPRNQGTPASAARLGAADPAALAAVVDAIGAARRPIVIYGLDLDPRTDAAVLAELVDLLGVPAFATPKAKGLLPEDHPLFGGVCAGVAGDAVIVELFAQADLLIGIGFEPVESDKLWHHTMKLVSIGPLSIASGAYRPQDEAVGDVRAALGALRARRPGPFAWTREDLSVFRERLGAALRPERRPAPGRLSPFELTRRLRDLMPGETVLTTDVGSIKLIVSQAWTSLSPLTFFESNGLSAMGYGLPAAMAARLQFPDAPILCTIGDGGFSMVMGEIETCVRERLHFLTVVFNDSALSMIDVAQQRRGYPTTGVRYGDVDFAAAAAALGAWTRRVGTMEELNDAVRQGLALDRPVVIEALVDPAEYGAHARSPILP